MESSCDGFDDVELIRPVCDAVDEDFHADRARFGKGRLKEVREGQVKLNLKVGTKFCTRAKSALLRRGSQQDAPDEGGLSFALRCCQGEEDESGRACRVGGWRSCVLCSGVSDDFECSEKKRRRKREVSARRGGSSAATHLHASHQQWLLDDLPVFCYSHYLYPTRCLDAPCLRVYRLFNLSCERELGGSQLRGNIGLYTLVIVST